MALIDSKPALLLSVALVCVLTARAADVSAQQSGSPAETGVEKLNASILELYKSEKYDEAIKLAKEALDATSRVSGESSRPYADALYIIASIYEKKLNYEDAVDFSARALSAYEKFAGTESSDILRPLHKLAVLLFLKRDYSKAEPLYHRAIAIKEKTSGLNDLKGVEILLQYACALRWSKKETEAAAVQARALSINWKESPNQLDSVYILRDCGTHKHMKLARPHYPNQAKAEFINGTVTVEVVVDETGNVISARALNGHKLLQGASVEAARSSKFEPLVIGGRPIKVRGHLSYTFTAEGRRR